MSECGKDKKVAHYAIPHFDVFCDLLLNRHTATWNLFVYIAMKQTTTDKTFFYFKIFQWKAAFARFGEHKKKPFDVIVVERA